MWFSEYKWVDEIEFRELIFKYKKNWFFFSAFLRTDFGKLTKFKYFTGIIFRQKKNWSWNSKIHSFYYLQLLWILRELVSVIQNFEFSWQSIYANFSNFKFAYNFSRDQFVILTRNLIPAKIIPLKVDDKNDTPCS